MVLALHVKMDVQSGDACKKKANVIMYQHVFHEDFTKLIRVRNDNDIY